MGVVLAEIREDDMTPKAREEYDAVVNDPRRPWVVIACSFEDTWTLMRYNDNSVVAFEEREDALANAILQFLKNDTFASVDAARLTKRDGKYVLTDYPVGVH